jgi:hypothetical protein
MHNNISDNIILYDDEILDNYKGSWKIPITSDRNVRVQSITCVYDDDGGNKAIVLLVGWEYSPYNYGPEKK